MVRREDELPDEPGDRLAYEHADRWKSDEFMDELLDRADAERE